MAEQLQTKPGADALTVTIGDMTTARAAGTFRLVYLVWNAIMNVTPQAEQVAFTTDSTNQVAVFEKLG
jgi:hypothetical protein